MKKNYMFLLLLLAGLMTCLTSCLDGNSENEYDGYLNGYVTITGTYPMYVLYVDGGGEVTLSIENMNKMTNNKGFGDFKRAFMQLGYKNENVTYKDNDKNYPVIREAMLLDGQFIESALCMDKFTAEMRKLNVADSTFAIEKYNDAWYYGSYLNIAINGMYSRDAKGNNILPTVSLMCDENDMQTDKVTFQLLYNRHSAKDAPMAGFYNFTNSFDVSNFMRKVPGSGEIEITIKAEKDQTKTFKVKR